jgi:hypothetical protein
VTAKVVWRRSAKNEPILPLGNIPTSQTPNTEPVLTPLVQLHNIPPIGRLLFMSTYLLLM